ncbi:MAG: hypothetical protein SRB2_00416 [Desulfobacteraceae bacterium Eth-SRB2]|nr:MAG: hypothetical protein SRB2_00416 [Desulfobacteraceae bacterium Eth-SRB2]
MKISLIYPARQMGWWPALGLAYVAAMLEKDGHPVQIVDRNPTLMRGDDVDSYTRRLLGEFKPDMVGITVTTPLLNDAIQALRISKKEIPRAPVVMGGPHVSVLPEDTLHRYPEIDVVVRGEGELTIPEIASGKPLPEILGISYRSNGKTLSNRARPPISNLDDLPFPARHLFDMEFYLRPDNTVIRGIEGIRATHILNSRGCFHKCAFCAGSAVFGRGVRVRSPENIVAEIQHLINDYNIEGLYFAEDVFFTTKERAEALCSAFVETGISKKIIWSGLVRANAAPPELIEMMKDAGCVHVECGFETGSPRLLKLIRKGATVKQGYETARAVHKAGLRLLASTIVGFPTETESEFDATLNFIRDVEPHFVGFNKFVPLPGSQFFNELSSEGKLITDDWEVFHVSGSVPHHEQISYSTMDGPAFFKKFSENATGFIEDLNLAGTIISALETLEEKRYGFNFSPVKLEMFTIEAPDTEKEKYEFCWEKLLTIEKYDESFQAQDVFSKANLSSKVILSLFNNFGVHLMEDFRLRSAASLLHVALKEEEHPLLLANLGVLFFRRREYRQTEEFFASSLARAEHHRKRISRNLANTFLLRGRLKKAKKAYEAIDKDFQCHDGLMGQAVCHILQGDFNHAINCWTRVSEKGNLIVAKQNIKAAQSLITGGGRVIGFKPISQQV